MEHVHWVAAELAFSRHGPYFWSACTPSQRSRWEAKARLLLAGLVVARMWGAIMPTLPEEAT